MPWNARECVDSPCVSRRPQQWRGAAHPYVRSKNRRRPGASRWVTTICPEPLLPPPVGQTARPAQAQRKSPGIPTLSLDHVSATRGLARSADHAQRKRWRDWAPRGAHIPRGPPDHPLSAVRLSGSSVSRILHARGMPALSGPRPRRRCTQGAPATSDSPATGRSVDCPIGWTVEPSFRRPRPHPRHPSPCPRRGSTRCGAPADATDG